jgi:hypothetical protein
MRFDELLNLVFHIRLSVLSPGSFPLTVLLSHNRLCDARIVFGICVTH